MEKEQFQIFGWWPQFYCKPNQLTGCCQCPSPGQRKAPVTDLKNFAEVAERELKRAHFLEGIKIPTHELQKNHAK